MIIPEFEFRNLSIGDGSIVGINNIGEFLNHISKYEKIPEKSLAELAPDYETAMACLVKMLESKFISLHPSLQYMFLKLHEIEDGEKKEFILETLLRKFRYEAIEARKIFDHYGMLGSSIDILKLFGKISKVKSEEINIPIPLKISAVHEAYDRNFDWIVPENLFDEESKSKSAERGTSKTTIDSIECLVETTFIPGLNDFSLDNT
jgi:hypothetical protein